MRLIKQRNANGDLVSYQYPHRHRKLPPSPTITPEMVAYSYKVGIVQAADFYKVPTYYIIKARNEANTLSPS